MAVQLVLVKTEGTGAGYKNLTFGWSSAPEGAENIQAIDTVNGVLFSGETLAAGENRAIVTPLAMGTVTISGTVQGSGQPLEGTFIMSTTPPTGNNGDWDLVSYS